MGDAPYAFIPALKDGAFTLGRIGNGFVVKRTEPERLEQALM